MTLDLREAPTGPNAARRWRAVGAGIVCVWALSATTAAAEQCAAPDAGQPVVLPGNEVSLSADELDGRGQGRSELRGNVELAYRGIRLSTPQLLYDAETGQAATLGGASFANRGFKISADDARVDIEGERAEFDQAEFALFTGGGRGQAGHLAVDSSRRARLDDVRYTTCTDAKPDWELRARQIRLDQTEGLGTARNARIMFKGVPLLYAPYFYFPTDDRRRTGFLVPEVGDSQATGFDVSIPFYINIAPAYDAQITPRYMARRGLQLNNHFGYLLPATYGTGEIDYDFLARDEAFGDGRSLFAYKHDGRLSDRWGLRANFTEVSDPGYFEDLGTTLNLAAITHLRREVSLAYQAPVWFSGELSVDDYQTIDRTVSEDDQPYRRAPRLSITALTPNAWRQIRLGADLEAVQFVRDNDVEGLRVDVSPTARFHHDAVGWFVGGRAGYRLTSYALENRTDGGPNSIDRALPSVSANAGLRFDRVAGDGLLQTLEPQIQYIYTPFENQDDIPLFDTALPDFSFTELFSRNRFLGVDRIADTNQLTVAATSRLLDVASGSTVLEAQFGQIYRLQPSNVGLTPNTPAVDSNSEIVSTLRYTPLDSLGFSIGWQYDPDTGKTNRGFASASYRPGDRLRLDASYRFRRDLLEQTDLVAKIPLTERWSIAGRWNFSLRDGRSRETLAGLEYRSCCWTGRIATRRYIANTQGTFNDSIYLQLEFSGLTRIGTGIDSLLPPL